MSAVVLYESPLTKEKISIDLPLEEHVDIEQVRRDLSLPDWVDLKDLVVRKAAVTIWASRNAPELLDRLGMRNQAASSPILAKVFGGNAFRFACRSSNTMSWFRRDLKDVDYLVPSRQAETFITLTTHLHQLLGSLHFHFVVKSDQRFSALREGKRFRMHMLSHDAQGRVTACHVDIFCHDKLSFCHNLDLSDVINADVLSVPLPYLILSKCQFIMVASLDDIGDEQRHRVLAEIGPGRVALGMEDKDIVDVAAAFADYDIDSKAFQSECMLRELKNDWALSKTVGLNLRNLMGVEHVLSSRGADQSTIAVISGRMRRLAERIEQQAPKQPRFRLRTIWWEPVEGL